MKVRLLTAKDLRWTFDDKAPYYHVGVSHGAVGRRVDVDPLPCYAADLALVEAMVAECVERAPLNGAGAANFYVLSHEVVGRTNAFTYEDWLYKRRKETVRDRDGKAEECYPQAHTIVLSGKRIPIMPAMVRYLVAHEYGHAVFNHVARWMGYGQAHHTLEEEYLRLRGAKPYRGTYAGCGWHKTASEIVANDFRVLVMEREPEFWPHEVPPPKPSSRIARWWANALDVCRAGKESR